MLVLWGLFSWLCGAWIARDLGWALLALGPIAALLSRQRQLARVRDWAGDVNAAPPPLGGIWDEILAPVYRQLRRNRQDLDSLGRQVGGIMLAAEALPDGAMTLNDAMQMTWCNQTASAHLGLDPRADRGHSIFNIVRSPEFARYARQERWSGPLLLRLGKDGRDTALLVQLTPYGLNQFLLVTRDVTQIEKLETTRQDFVANVSHELRTPLTVLGGFLETLRDMPMDSMTAGQRDRYLALMLEQAQRMQAIVDDLLTLSTLESSPPEQGRPVDFGAVIATALAQARVLSAGRHVFVEDVAPDLSIVGNANELASAALNLLTNAVRYTPPGGTITVGWRRTDKGGASYSVQDTGIGIAPHDIPRLTERFYRVDRGRSRASGGTGLGLAITKHVAIRHQAELEIDSRLNAGSRFRLDFPAARVAEDGNAGQADEI